MGMCNRRVPVEYEAVIFGVVAEKPIWSFYRLGMVSHTMCLGFRWT